MVIPAQAGIQRYRVRIGLLDSGFHRNDGLWNKSNKGPSEVEGFYKKKEQLLTRRSIKFGDSPTKCWLLFEKNSFDLFEGLSLRFRQF